MNKLTPKTLAVLLEGARRHDGRISPCCYERHRKALVARGLVDRSGILTAEGKRVAVASLPNT